MAARFRRGETSIPADPLGRPCILKDLRGGFFDPGASGRQDQSCGRADGQSCTQRQCHPRRCRISPTP